MNLADEDDVSKPPPRMVPSSVAVRQSMHRWAMRALRSGALPEQRVVAEGVTAVALWRRRACGSVLFHCDASASDLAFPAVLRHVDGRRTGPWWRCTGGGGHSEEEKPRRPGLSVSGGAGDGRQRLLIGRASPETSVIRLVQGDRSWNGPVGHDGFVLLGRRVSDPAITAVALDADGRPLGDAHRV
jgi:hypothetical protein